MYEVVFDSEAIDALNKLQKTDKERIFKKIIAARENPFHFFERLAGRRDYKLRVGSYRVIADIDGNRKVIQITLAGHRKNIYNRLDT